MLRLVHTADWHLGHSLHGCSREWEHAQFLAWLVDTLEEEEADALLVAGDIFDSANPPASAQRALFEFLAACRRRLPALDVVLVAGNHDSPARLEAPAPVLEAFGVHAVGRLPRTPLGALDAEGLLAPLHDRDGAVAAWCAAIPYLRPHDLPTLADSDDPLVAGVFELHREVVAALEAKRERRQLLVATGHCYMAGGRLSELSERKILGGNQHALPAEIFPPGLAYVALGHLHLAQQVAGRPEIHYSGSPLPLSLAESGYRHQVLRVDLQEGAPATVQPIAAPRWVEMLHLPEEGPRPLPELLERLRQLELPATQDPRQWPYLELRVALERPRPELREEVNAALDGQPVRLLRISTTAHAGAPDAADEPSPDLAELSPVEVFERCYRGQYHDPPPAELMAAFFELLQQVEEDEG